MKEKPKKKDGFFKDNMVEFFDSVIIEVIWNIITFIPRVIVRLLRFFD